MGKVQLVWGGELGIQRQGGQGTWLQSSVNCVMKHKLCGGVTVKDQQAFVA